MLNTTMKVVGLTMLVVFAYALAALPRALGNSALTAWLLSEDMLYESLGALFCLAGGLLALLAWRPANAEARATAPATGLRWLAALFLLLMFAEEVSWGQRLIGFDTPDWLRRHNAPGEVNLHNLNAFQPSLGVNLLQVAWMTLIGSYLGLLPILAVASTKLREGLHRRRWPVPDLDVGLACLASFSLRSAFQSAQSLAGSLIAYEPSEVHETAIEGLLFVVSFRIARRVQQASGAVGRWLGRPTLAAAVVMGMVTVLMIGRALQTPVDEMLKQRSLALVSAAVESVHREDLIEAERRFAEALALYDNNPEAHFLMGVAYLEAGHLDRAIQQFQRVLVLEALHGETHTILGGLFWQQGDLHAAKRHFTHALEHRPHDRQLQQHLRSVREALAGVAAGESP